MKKILKYIGDCLCLILVAIIVISIAETFFLKNEYTFVYKIALILSGSMEPTISIDDLVIIEKAEEINEGDIIVFYDENGKEVIHRVIGIEDDTITTKGDANNTSDIPIQRDKVCGKYVTKIRYAGKIIKFIKTPLGVSICFILTIIILVFPERYEGKHAQESNSSTKVKIIIATISYAILLIVCIVAGYYSKYTKVLGGKSSAQVARFIINTNSSENNNLVLTKNDQSVSYTFNVSNENTKNVTEVDVTYDVIVTFPSELKNIILLLKKDETIINGIVSDEGKTITFLNVGTFKAGVKQMDNLSLNFTLNTTDIQSNVLNNIQINVRATQID